MRGGKVRHRGRIHLSWIVIQGMSRVRVGRDDLLTAKCLVAGGTWLRGTPYGVSQVNQVFKLSCATEVAYR